MEKTGVITVKMGMMRGHQASDDFGAAKIIIAVDNRRYTLLQFIHIHPVQ